MGFFYKGSGWGRTEIGEAEGPRIRASGAACLLLWYL